jgi:hypothetical protein
VCFFVYKLCLYSTRDFYLLKQPITKYCTEVRHFEENLCSRSSRFRQESYNNTGYKRKTMDPPLDTPFVSNTVFGTQRHVELLHTCWASACCRIETFFYFLALPDFLPLSYLSLLRSCSCKGELSRCVITKNNRPWSNYTRSEIRGFEGVSIGHWGCNDAWRQGVSMELFVSVYEVTCIETHKTNKDMMNLGFHKVFVCSIQSSLCGN